MSGPGSASLELEQSEVGGSPRHEAPTGHQRSAGSRHLLAGNRALATVLREGADAAATDTAGVGTAGEESAEGDVEVDVGDDATLVVATGPDGQQLTAIAETKDEAESWAKRLIDPQSAIYAVAGFVPGGIVGGAFFLNDETKKLEAATRDAIRRNTLAKEQARLDERRRGLPWKVAKRSGVIAIGDLGDNYGRMVIISDNQVFVDGNKTLDAMARLGLNVTWTVAYAKLYNFTVSTLGFGPKNRMGDDYTVPNKMIGLRIAIGPTIMWLNSMVDRLGLEEDDPRLPFLRAATVGGGVAGAIMFEDLASIGAAARVAERAAALGTAEAGEQVAKRGVRGWLARFAGLIGASVNRVLNLPTDLLRGITTQFTESVEMAKKIKELGIVGGIKQARIPGVLKVGPATFILPSAQAYVSTLLGPPPQEKEDVLDAKSSIIARNIWFNFAEPGVFFIGTGPVGMAAAALKMYQLALADTDKSSHAVSTAIDHAKRLKTRVDLVADASRDGGLEANPAATRAATQLRQGLAEGGFSSAALDQLVKARASGASGTEEERRLLEELVDSLVGRYFRIHNSDLGTSDLSAYNTYLRIAVGLPADGELVAAAE